MNTIESSPDEAVQALQSQIEAVEDAIGQAAVTWRHAAAHPAAMAAAAERLSVLERQRELLLLAISDAKAEQATAQQHRALESARDVIEPIRAVVLAALDRRDEAGRALAKAVEQVAGLVRQLHVDGQALANMFAAGEEAQRISGVTAGDETRALNAEDVRYCIDQVLAARLGTTLWPTATAPASRDIDIVDRVRRGGAPLRIAFEHGVAERLSELAAGPSPRETELELAGLHEHLQARAA